MIQSLIRAFSNLFRSPLTVNYPKDEIILPKGYRGLIEYDADYCIFCNKCEKACPPEAILFEQNMDGSQTYNYNPYVCIYCGECVRACPKPEEALWQSEKKQSSALQSDAVNSKWSKMHEQTRKSKEQYADYKAEEKQRKAEEKSLKKD